MTVAIMTGDARTRLLEIPDASVQCCITSPPYFGLRDYGHGDQIGLEPTPDEFVEALVGVFRQVRRVLRDDGTLWLNLGDSYAGNRGTNSENNRGLVESRRRDNTPIPRSDGRVPGLKPKDLIGIPWRVAFALRDDGCADLAAVRAIDRACDAIVDACDGTIPDRVLGALERLRGEYAEAKGASWYLRQDLIWHKPNPMPESVTDRCTKAHEYVFLLSKSDRYFYDAIAIAEQANYPQGPGNTENSKYVQASKTDARHQTKAGFAEIGGRETRNKRSVWSVPTQPYTAAHFATFPPALIEPCILAGTSAAGCCRACRTPFVRHLRVTSPDGRVATKRGSDRTATTEDGSPLMGDNMIDRGERGSLTASRGVAVTETIGWVPDCACDSGPPVPCTVLDPFFGAGTTGLVADRLGRNVIGIELNPEFAGLAERRIAGDVGHVSRTIGLFI